MRTSWAGWSASSRTSRPVVLEALLAALAVERIAAPLASIVAALGHIGDPGTLARLFPLADHRSAEVRLAVAFAVATISPQPLAPEARTALIRLSRDTDPEVRDWATFGLGTLSDVDGPDVRAALLARAEDAHHEARAEALFGLAVRRDPRAVPHLIRALQSPLVGGLEVDAAAAAADPRLLPALLGASTFWRRGRGPPPSSHRPLLRNGIGPPSFHDDGAPLRPI